MFLEIKLFLSLFIKKMTNMPTLSKVLDILSATARVTPDLLKALAILSDTIVSCKWLRRPKTILEI